MKSSDRTGKWRQRTLIWISNSFASSQTAACSAIYTIGYFSVPYKKQSLILLLQRFQFWILLFSPLNLLNGWHIHYPSAWMKKKAFRWETVFWVVASGLAEDCCEISTWHVLTCGSSFERKEIQPHLPHLLQRPFFAMDECFCFMLFMDAMSRVNIYSSSDCHLTI